MAGYLLSSFLCVFMDQDGDQVHNYAKKLQDQYPVILTKHTQSINDLLYSLHFYFIELYYIDV